MGLQKVRIELTGQIFGNLRVLGFAGKNKWNDAMWRCQCLLDRNETIVLGRDLRRGKTKSCGCGSTQKGDQNPRYSHGQNMVGRVTPEYQCWVRLKMRCYNTASKDYPDYGGRGIIVCDRWLKSFENFYADMGNKPEPKRQYSLDRINNNGNYEPSNCRWATHIEQANNRRPRRCPHCKHILYAGDLKKKP